MRVMEPLDRLGRPLHDLRISVTDRCNFRCTYCMPREVFGRDYSFLPRAELLTFEEIERVARVFVSLGVNKLRITGGEPLLRRDLELLVARLRRRCARPGRRGIGGHPLGHLANLAAGGRRAEGSGGRIFGTSSADCRRS